MINVIGTVSVTAAWLGAAALAVVGLLAGFRKSESLLRGARYTAGFIFVAMLAAVGAMEYALLTHDFSVEYVAQVGSRETPPYYTAISLWSSLEGSILFWGLILALIGGVLLLVGWLLLVLAKPRR